MKHGRDELKGRFGLDGFVSLKGLLTLLDIRACTEVAGFERRGVNDLTASLMQQSKEQSSFPPDKGLNAKMMSLVRHCDLLYLTSKRVRKPCHLECKYNNGSMLRPLILEITSSWLDWSVPLKACEIHLMHLLQ